MTIIIILLWQYLVFTHIWVYDTVRSMVFRTMVPFYIYWVFISIKRPIGMMLRLICHLRWSFIFQFWLLHFPFHRAERRSQTAIIFSQKKFNAFRSCWGNRICCKQFVKVFLNWVKWLYNGRRVNNRIWFNFLTFALTLPNAQLCVRNRIIITWTILEHRKIVSSSFTPTFDGMSLCKMQCITSCWLNRICNS